MIWARPVEQLTIAGEYSLSLKLNGGATPVDLRMTVAPHAVTSAAGCTVSGHAWRGAFVRTRTALAVHARDQYGNHRTTVRHSPPLPSHRTTACQSPPLPSLRSRFLNFLARVAEGPIAVSIQLAV